MAFKLDLGQFVGGVSDVIYEKVKAEEAQAREDESWDRKQKAIQDAADNKTRGDRRRADERSAEEMLGAFKALGLGDELASQLTAQGKGAFAIHVDQIKRANALGLDYNTIWGLSPEAGQSQAIEETISSIPSPKVYATGSLEAASSVAKIPTVSITPEQEDIFNAAGVNIDVIQQLYKPLPKIEASYDARIAVISQRKLRSKDKSEIDALEAERKKLLQEYKELKTAGRAEEGEDTPSFGVGTIASNTSMFTRLVLPTYGFGVVTEGLNTALDTDTMNEGNKHLYDIANLRVSEMLNDLNKGFNDPNMLNTIVSMQNTSNIGLKEYAYDVLIDPERKKELVTDVLFKDFAEAAAENQYKPGKIFKVTKKNNSIMYVVYTGVTDFKTNMNFLTIDE